MEIIKQGTAPSEKEYEATCHTCSPVTVVRFKQSEGKITHDQRDGDFIQVNCPVCGHTITKNLR